ncbi:RING finger protein 17 [Dunckerocampus dactyliophorus]|uniref:RING finger protein 17 n=1 Tax=Dunckerocampus dactyliophorus TaxID=161453 RepID=UPI0024052BD7|nr:RING finger protein 17 [Dunckerocampus dactyliophorus]XP_054643205.1 RING finger protein 17 [Dunckerocampus dactyliophorus]
MEHDDHPSAVICSFCGNAYTLPENEVEGNPPRVLICGHIFCTSCLQSIECSNVVRCPECEVASSLPEEGVFGLQEDARIIGLIYTIKMNKTRSQRFEKSNSRIRMYASPNVDGNSDEEQPVNLEEIEKAIDEALATAAENLAKLEYLHETLTTGFAEQVKQERTRLETEINQAADNALNATQKWRDVQLSQLNKLEARFSNSQAEVCSVKDRITLLENAMQKVKKVRCVPFLKQYGDLDKVLETLQAPVDNQSFGMKCLTLGSGMSVIFRSLHQAQSVGLFIKMDMSKPNTLPVMPPPLYQHGGLTPKPPQHHVQALTNSPLSHSRAESPRKPMKRSTRRMSPSYRRASLSPTRRSNPSRHNSSSSEHAPSDVVIEEVIQEEQQDVVPPTGPALANDKRRTHRRGSRHMYGGRRNVSQLVVVTHVVNPCHFYVRYVAEKWEHSLLSKKVNCFCAQDNSCFTSIDTVETGSVIFAKGKDGLWCRANVLELFQNGHEGTVDVCPVSQLSSVQIFFTDYGFTENISMERFCREGATPESLVNHVNYHLRKVNEAVNAEMARFFPQAVRCSLKDLVPYCLTKGWSQEAQVEFCRVVGSAAVEMHPLGQDRDFLLVDLKRGPVDQSSDVAISVREYLVFVEVARFYCPVKPGRRPLKYYSAVYPKILIKYNAVVSHINSPGDFYIQLTDSMESLLLSAKLQDCYNAKVTAGDDDLVIYCPVIGQACVARFEDNSWYRAEVIGHPGDRKVEVHYIDFGKKATVLVSDLRKIKDEFFSLPVLAIRCCLADVLPLSGETWRDGCISRFVSLAHHKLFEVVATEKSPKTEPLPVKLYESDSIGSVTNIAEVLIAEQLACSKEGLKSTDAEVANDGAIWDLPIGLNADDRALDPSDGHDSRGVQFKPQLSFPKSLKDVKVRVSHVASPSSFFVQFAQSDAQLKRLNELLKEECERLEAKEVEWKPDMTCAVHINGVWERGQICSDVTSSSVVEVKRCDHGNKVKLDLGNLRPLPSSLEGSFALECSLTDIRPAGGQPTWTATACDFMSYYLSGASALITIQELTDQRPVPVTLLCTDKMGELVSISDFLASEGLALRERKPAAEKLQESRMQAEGSKAAKTMPMPPVSSLPTPPVRPKPTPRTTRPTEKVKTDLYKAPELPRLGVNHMTVSAVREDGLIYARTQNAVCLLAQLREKIQQSMKTLPNQKPYTWKTVQGCAVIGPDMLWYRGQLLEVMGGHVKVQYVDYGLVENIPVVHVYPRLLCGDIPQLCVACRLHGVSPVGGSWHQNAVELLKETLLYRHVDVDVLEVPSDPRQPLTVEIFIDGMRLNTILCHHKHVTMDSTALKTPSLPSAVTILDGWDLDTEGLTEPQEVLLGPFTESSPPREGEQLKVQVRHLQTPNELFLCWKDTTDLLVEGETLDQLLTTVNADKDGLQALTNFPYGGPCLAEYSNGSFYRAKIIEIISADPVMILVQHVDFGSHDTVPTSKLRQMPVELLRFPVQVLKVHVAGFKAPSASVEGEVLPYSPEWSVKATLAMMDLLHGNLTASVETWEPELSVLLYNEDGDLVFLPLVESGLVELQ